MLQTCSLFPHYYRYADLRTAADINTDREDKRRISIDIDVLPVSAAESSAFDIHTISAAKFIVCWEYHS